MKYCSDDGKNVFNTEQECLEYEKKLAEEKSKAEQMKKEAAEELDEITKTFSLLKSKVENYYKKYGKYPTMGYNPRVTYSLLDFLLSI